MRSIHILIVCLMATLSTGVAVAASPVAYVYTGTPGGIHAFSASSAGKLTPIKGSPFPAKVLSLAGNGKYLFGVEPIAGNNLNSVGTWEIASNGALKFVRSINLVSRFPSLGLNLITPYIFFDHTGQSLYIEVFTNEYPGGAYLSFNVEKGTGELNYLGDVATAEYTSPTLEAKLTFSGNNQYAYQGSYNLIGGYTRLGDGLLVHGPSGDPTTISAPSGVVYYAMQQAASDPHGNVAVVVQQTNGQGSWLGFQQFAAFTPSSDGNLTTTNTASSVPMSWVNGVTAIAMSPAGNLLAATGGTGIELFDFNGGAPLTYFGGQAEQSLLNVGTYSFNYPAWDKANHLYAINMTTKKLHVYDVSLSSAKEAAGSPYLINQSVYDVYVLAR
jgi:hypothetical protein